MVRHFLRHLDTQPPRHRIAEPHTLCAYGVGPAASNDVFGLRVPLDRAALAQRRDSHLAGDGGAVAKFERAIWLTAAADAFEEILHVLVGLVRPSHDIGR